MKLTCLVILLNVVQSFAGKSSAQTANISVNLRNVTVETVLQTVEEQTDFYFLYSRSLVDVNRKVDLQVRDVKIADLLNILFDGTTVSWGINGRQIVLLESESRSEQQQKTVSGKVTDSSGTPLPGVTVIIEGTTIGTITEADGAYNLSNVSAGATLVFSFVGMKTQEVKIAGKALINIKLEEETVGIEEVVAIGYGIQKKVNLTGAVTNVTAKDIRNLPVANLSTALSGRMPGVNISQSTGRPGVGSSISIRGTGTWNDATPLYVIDGVIRDKFAFDGLDANEIENLSVLKDGSSAAIYGARAANGVILVTTKKGEYGKPIISYSGSVGISDATSIPQTLSAYDNVRSINDYYESQLVPVNDARYYSSDELEFYRKNEYNWLEEAWKQPLLTKHSVNVSGGNEIVRYFVGGNYYYETGSFDKLNYVKYNFRGNIEANITKNLIASLNLNMDTRNDNKPYWRWDSDSDDMANFYLALLIRSKTIPPYIDGKAVGNNINWHPLALIKSGGYNRKRYTTDDATFSLEYKVPFLQGLSIKVMGNLYRLNYFTKQFNRPYPLYVFKTAGTNGHLIADNHELDYIKTRSDGDYMYEKYSNERAYQLDGYINYSRQFGDHSVDAVLIAEQSEGFSDWFYGQRNYFITSEIDQLDAGDADSKNSTLNGNGSETARISYAGRANYSYAQKYLLEFSFRYDGSVKFAPSRRWGFFPSVSGGWRISEEEFFKENVNIIDNLKLRASFGLLGNDAVGGWQWAQRYQLTSGAQFGSLSQGVTTGAIPNTSITWEKSASYNMGLDAGFFDNRLTFIFDGFYRHTYDILGSRIGSIPDTFGASLPDENYATINTKGLEVQIGYQNVIGKVSYNVRGNLGYAVNNLINKDEAANIRTYQSEIGLNTDRMMGYFATGIIRTQADLEKLPDGYTLFGRNPELGMLNYKDLRGANSDTPDGKIDGNDQDWIINHTVAPVNYGVGLAAEWKGFGIDLFLQGVTGNNVMIGNKYIGRYFDPSAESSPLAYWEDHWTSENPDAEFPGMVDSGWGGGTSVRSTFWKRDGSYLRLKNLSFSYNFPKSVIEKLRVSNLRIYFNGTNLFLLQNHVKYFDPELPYLEAYPIMKNYSFGVNLSL